MDMDRLLYTVDAMQFEAERAEHKANTLNQPKQADRYQAVAYAYGIIKRMLTDAEYADHMAQYYLDDEPWHVDWD